MKLSPDSLPSAADLEAMDTLAEGYTCDLKVDGRLMRIWLHRTSIEDGEPYRNTVSVEVTFDGRWYDVLTYDGDDPSDVASYIWTVHENLIDRVQGD
jgi:hypothetical protein